MSPPHDPRRWHTLRKAAAFATYFGVRRVLDGAIALASPLAPTDGGGGRSLATGAVLLLAGVGLGLGAGWARWAVVAWLGLIGAADLLVGLSGRGDAWDLLLGALYVAIAVAGVRSATAPPAGASLRSRLLYPGVAVALATVETALPFALGTVTPTVRGALPHVRESPLREVGVDPWVGLRVRIGQSPRAARDTGPVTVARGDDGLLHVTGLQLARPARVVLDPLRNALEIEGWVFRGRLVEEGPSPVFTGLRHHGLVFERSTGRVRGRASALLLSDGRLVLDLAGVLVDGVPWRERAVFPARAPGGGRRPSWRRSTRGRSWRRSTRRAPRPRARSPLPGGHRPGGAATTPASLARGGEARARTGSTRAAPRASRWRTLG